MKIVYAVYANSDSMEGRGHDVLKGLYTTEEQALEKAKHLGPMGCSDGVVEKTMVIEPSDDLAKIAKDERIRNILLSFVPGDLKLIEEHFKKDQR